MLHSKNRTKLFYDAWTSTLLLATSLISPVSLGANCPNPVTGDCTVGVGNSGYTIADTATLTLAGADIDGSVLIDPNITATLSFTTSQQITGAISAVNDTGVLVIQTPSNITSTIVNGISNLANISLTGSGTIIADNSLGAETFNSGDNATLTLDSLTVNVSGKNAQLFAFAVDAGNATVALGNSHVTVNNVSGQVYAFTAQAGNATLTLDNGSVNLPQSNNQLYAFAAQAGNATVTLNNGSVSIPNGQLYAFGANTGNATLTLGNVNVTMAGGNLYAFQSAAGNATVTLGNGNINIPGNDIYAHTNIGNATLIAGGGQISAQNLYTTAITSGNATTTLGSGPIVLSGDLGSYSNSIGTLTIGTGAVTTSTLFANASPPVVNLTIGLGGLTVTGKNFTLANHNTLVFNLDGAVPNATLFNFPNCRLTLDVGSTISAENVPYVTQTLTLASANMFTDNGATYIPISVPGLTGTWTHNANKIQLHVNYTGTNIANNAIYSNTIGIGGALSQLNLNALSAELLQIFNSINLASSNPAAMNNALAALAPLVDGSTVGIWNLQTLLTNLLLEGYGQPQEQRYYIAGDSQEEHHLWVAGLGTHLNQQMRQNVAGYRGSLEGVALGADTLYDAGNVGIALDISNLTLDANISPSTTHVNHYAIDLYGRYAFIDGVLSGGYNQYHSTRNIYFGTVSISPQADYHAWQVDALVRAGFDYDACFVNIHPFVLTQYDYLTLQQYTETNAGTANQSVASADYDQFLVGAGVGLAHTWECDRVTIQPDLYANILYALKNATMQTSSQFVGGGPAFITQGFTPSRTQYHLGAEISLISQGGWDTRLGYDAQIQNDFLAQSAFFRWCYSY